MDDKLILLIIAFVFILFAGAVCILLVKILQALKRANDGLEEVFSTQYKLLTGLDNKQAKLLDSLTAIKQSVEKNMNDCAGSQILLLQKIASTLENYGELVINIRDFYSALSYFNDSMKTSFTFKSRLDDTLERFHGVVKDAHEGASSFNEILGGMLSRQDETFQQIKWLNTELKALVAHLTRITGQAEIKVKLETTAEAEKLLLSAKEIQQNSGQGLVKIENQTKELQQIRQDLKALSTPKKGGCFIATAAFGTIDEPVIEIYRDFRETVLRPHRSGACLITIYETLSPFPASVIAKHQWLRAVVRKLLSSLSLLVLRITSRARISGS